ncbi:hypothetical protein AX769_02960 [Frondihabitans sp. PAMC 28766]|uniref:DUF308 domain-containing protein n=1 Tax=Frondihabitans sp. PAMC 28766 TaxID=1795630 RepID=UPI00078C6D62|nr:DUF308 domain-containing protein [Frondihabitans sp. PAMC 28766]AMM19283.1 hypothetical protein AX769_02960 [Frondihabitans sp. PAMC 28766]
MTAIQHDAASDARYWPVPVLRAIPFLVLGMVTTFVNNHSAAVGLPVFGATTVAGGILLGLGSYRWLDDRTSRTLFIVQGAVGVVFGALALIFHGLGLTTLVALVTGWAVIAGVIELFAGLRRRRRSGLARDWMLLGGTTLVLGIVYLVVPTDYDKPFGGIEHVPGSLTSSTILVGIVGAYGALVGVFLVIQGLSLKWQTNSPEAALAASPGDTPIDGAHRS